MPQLFFENIVDQVMDMGFNSIGITPLTGDVFMDKGFFEKLAFLEKRADVREYNLFTNFILPTEDQIRELSELKKLSSLFISVYGHDRKTFCAITQRGEKQYKKLIANLHSLSKYFRPDSFKLTIGWRTTLGFKQAQTPENRLQSIVKEFSYKKNVSVEEVTMYNNWGGLVKPEDVKGLGIIIRDGSHLYRKGPCALIFAKMIVLADGRVNACGCRDVNGDLIIGNIKEKPLNFILSLNNPLYARLIRQQMNNQFANVCRTCDMYQSIFKQKGWLEDNPEALYDLPYVINMIRGNLRGLPAGQKPRRRDISSRVQA